MDAAEWHLRQPFRFQQRRRQPARRPPAGVQPKRAGAGRLGDNRKQIAANAVHLRLDDTHDRVRGDGRVDGVAVTLEDLHAGPSCEWLAGGNDAVLRRDFRSAGDDTHDG